MLRFLFSSASISVHPCSPRLPLTSLCARCAGCGSTAVLLLLRCPSMRPASPVKFLAALLLPLLARPMKTENGSAQLAHDQFETAKACFNRQDYPGTLRLLSQVKANSPHSGAPWLLAGHCFYLQGQDQAALFHYKRARDLNPR